MDPPYLNNPMNFTYTNTNQTHPLQQNVQEYYQYKKYVSIHSEDRDALAYPNSAQFEIQLPEDITNISTVRLVDWTFPSNYSIFSVLNGNTSLAFTINDAYNPTEHNNTDPLQLAIYEALSFNYNGQYLLYIEDGFYNPNQLTTEITNKMNEAVTLYIEKYFMQNGYSSLLPDLEMIGGYNRFVLIYNTVSLKIWFGNRADVFTILSEKNIVATSLIDVISCQRNQLPDFSNYGLPGNIGLKRCNTTSIQVSTSNIPRFYYGDITLFGDNGFWLLPDPLCTGAMVSYIECQDKINLFGPSCFYICINELNCIDVTSPYNVSNFTLTTNQTNGITNFAFAKINLSSTPISQFFDFNSPYYKFFAPPKDRIRRLNISLKYHNGQLVDFGTFPYTFSLEFTQLIPMKARALTIINK
jgi:hypothetical protein